MLATGGKGSTWSNGHRQSQARQHAASQRLDAMPSSGQVSGIGRQGAGARLQRLEVRLLAEPRQAREVGERVAGHAALRVGAVGDEGQHRGAAGLRDLLQQLHVRQHALRTGAGLGSATATGCGYRTREQQKFAWPAIAGAHGHDMCPHQDRNENANASRLQANRGPQLRSVSWCCGNLLGVYETSGNFFRSISMRLIS